MSEMTDKVLFSVIIVNYNSLSFLKECINTLWKYNDIGKQLEIIVVDNSTNDESIQWLSSQKDIISIKNENRGFGQGNNVGARIARGDYLLFLNPDTELVEPLFNFAINKFEADVNLGMFGVQLITKDGRRNSTYGLRMPIGLIRTIQCKLLITLKVFIPRIMYTSGADIFIRKSVFFNAGEFDEAFFLYCEEADLSNRVNSIGYKNDFFGEKKIIHLEGKTTEEGLYKMYTRQFESRKHYCEKNNIELSVVVRKEKRYCRIKKAIYSILKKKSRSNEYGRIIEYLDGI